MCRTAVVVGALAMVAVLGTTPRAGAERALFGTRAVALDASFGTLLMMRNDRDERAEREDPELSARHIYEVLAALPTVESTIRTYDVRPVVNFVFGQTVQLTGTIVVKFARGRNLVQANLGPGRTLGVVPNGFGVAQGGILSFSTDF